MTIVINDVDELVVDNDSYTPNTTGDDNGVIVIGTAIEATTGADGSFGGIDLGAAAFSLDALHDSSFSFGTRTFTHALGWILDASVPSSASTFDRAITGTFDADTHALISVSGLDQSLPFKESAQVDYNNQAPANITYDIDAGGAAILVVSTNVNNVDQTAIEAEGWLQQGNSKSLDIISDYRIFTRTASVDETGTTVTPAMTGNGNGRGFARVFVFNGVGAVPDTTPPVLSVPTAATVTSIGCVPTVTTDEDNGTCYTVVVPDGDSPSLAQIKTGLQSNGSAALYAENITVSATGVVAFDTIQALAMDTDFEVFFVHTDASANDSNIVSIGFKTLFRGLTTLIENYAASGVIQNYPHGANNTSGSDYDEETNRWGAIRNNAAELYEYDPSDLGTIVRTVTLNGMDNDSDTEGMVYMGRGELAIVTEGGGRYQLCIFDLPTGTTDIAIVPKQILLIAASDINNNSALECIAFNKITQTFYGGGEGEQVGSDRRFFTILRPGVLGRFGDTTTNFRYDDADDGDGWSLDDYVTEPFVAETAFASLGATGGDFDIAGMFFDQASGNVVIVSDTGGKAVQIDVTDGTIVSEGVDHLMQQAESGAVLIGGDIRFSGEPDQYRLFVDNALNTVEADYDVVVNLLESVEADYDVVVNLLQRFETDYDIAANLLQTIETNYNIVSNYLISNETDYDVNLDVLQNLETNYDVAIDLLQTVEKTHSALVNLLQSQISDYDVNLDVLQQIEADYVVDLTAVGHVIVDYVVQFDLLSQGTVESSFDIVLDLLQQATSDYNVNCNLLQRDTADYITTTNLLQQIEAGHVSQLDFYQSIEKDFVFRLDLLSGNTVTADYDVVVNLREQIEKEFSPVLDLLQTQTNDYDIVSNLLNAVSKDFIAQIDLNESAETGYTISLDCIGRLEKTFDVVFSMGDLNIVPQHYVITVDNVVNFSSEETTIINFNDDDDEPDILII